MAVELAVPIFVLLVALAFIFPPSKSDEKLDLGHLTLTQQASAEAGGMVVLLSENRITRLDWQLLSDVRDRALGRSDANSGVVGRGAGGKTAYLSPPPELAAGPLRIRLGDVFVSDQAIHGWTYGWAGVADERISFDPGNVEQKPAPAAAALSWPGLIPSAQAQEAGPEQRPARKPSALGQVTTRSIVQNAIATALLLAERRGQSQIVFGLDIDVAVALGGDRAGQSNGRNGELVSAGGRVFAELTAETVKILLPHLTRLRRVVVGPWLDQADMSIGYLSKFWGLAATPLPWPGGSAFTAWRQPKPDVLTTQRNLLFAPQRLLPGRTTLLPLALYLGLVAWLWARRKVRSAGDRIGPISTGAGFSIIATAVMVALIFALRYLWLWFPDAVMAADWDGVSHVGATALLALISGGAALACDAGFRRLPWEQAQEPDDAADDEAERKKADEQERLDEATLRVVLNRDAPVEQLNDDRLNFAPLVTALARFLRNRDTYPPLVIGINGPWGSGKSSAMKMLEHELKSGPDFHSVWFNAWEYHREEQILAAFLKTIADRLSVQWGPWFAVKLAFARLLGCGSRQ